MAKPNSQAFLFDGVFADLMVLSFRLIYTRVNLFLKDDLESRVDLLF